MVYLIWNNFSTSKPMELCIIHKIFSYRLDFNNIVLFKKMFPYNFQSLLLRNSCRADKGIQMKQLQTHLKIIPLVKRCIMY